jgi:uncharacterized protein (TIGR04222 family)
MMETTVGIDFLTFYTGIWAAAMFSLWVFKKATDNTAQLGEYASEEPYLIAYLRGKTKGLTETVLAALLYRKALLLNEEGKIEVNPNLGKAEKKRIAGNHFEQIVLDTIAPRAETLTQLLGKSSPLLKKMDKQAEMHPKKYLQDKKVGLLFPKNVVSLRKQFTNLVTGGFVAFGAYRLINGILADRPIGFLLLMMAVGTAFLAGYGSSLKKEITERGKAHLRKLVLIYKPLRQSLAQQTQEEEKKEELVPHLALASLFGISAWAAVTPAQAGLAQHYRPTSTPYDSGYSVCSGVSSCSSGGDAGSSCSGGSCSSGCGGCGGCGG